MTAKPVGIRDVAAAAGVSVTTVSHVLNETPHTRTSAETQTRVKEVAARLGYRPNRLAQGLRTQASGVIGLVTEEIAITPYAGRIIQGAQEAAEDQNLALAIVNSPLNPEPEIDPELPRVLLDRQADGVIYATVYHDEVVVPKQMREVPSVLIGARDVAGKIPSVMPDERAGVVAVVEMLVAQGHRRIAFLASSVDVPATRGRAFGYEDAMRDAGLDPEGLVAEGVAEAVGGYEATMELFRRDATLADRPTALVCYNDRMAMGAYRAARELGLDIPTDLSVVGFDDQVPIPNSLYPTLTTVGPSHYDMGVWAVETLASLSDPKTSADRSWAEPTLLPCPIIHRDSVAPPTVA